MYAPKLTPRTCHHVLLPMSVLLLLLNTGIIRAQPASLYTHLEPVALNSGACDNPSDEPVVAFSEIVDVGPDIPWTRVLFSSASLGDGSIVKITSLLDGAFQTLNARQLDEWGYASAFFNGPAVKIDLIAGPRTRGNFIRTERILAGDASPIGIDSAGIEEQVPRTICGTDDRFGMSFLGVGRLLTGMPFNDESLRLGCTGFIIDRPTTGVDKCHLSAGHCFTGIPPNDASTVLQFAVPLSNADCTLYHPDPEFQFAVIRSSVAAENAGCGNDWAVFQCFRNPVTGLSTFQTEGFALPLAALIPGAGSMVEIDGFGVDGGAPDPCGGCVAMNADAPLNQASQTESGPLFACPGGPANTIHYQVDTCGGNSGSPVIFEGEVIGIHTAGGCDSPDAQVNSCCPIALRGTLSVNSGTSILAVDLQAKIAECAQQPQPPHTVHDHLFSSAPASWGEGQWTKDGIVICTTFPGGAQTGGLGEPNKKWDWEGCNDWPNDWHWHADFLWNQIPISVWVWFENFGISDQLGVDIFCSDLHPQYELVVDVGSDTYSLNDGQGGPTFFTGAWSAYPGNLPSDFEQTTLWRGNFEPPIKEIIPAVSDVGLVVLLLLMAVAGVIVIRRARRGHVAG